MIRAAVVAGASSGLGTQFARYIDKNEQDIDIIYLIARRKDRLEALARELKKRVCIAAFDATNDEAASRFHNTLYADGAIVDIFINCIGYAKIGNYAAVSTSETMHMIDTDVKAAVRMTLCVLPFMRENGRLMQICSTAAFQPLQHMNVYAASKAFLYSYTRALRMELLPRGIIVTAVCPWWIRDTEFISVATNNDNNKNVASSVRNFYFTQDSKSVVRRAMRANRIGFAVSTPGVMCTLHRIFCKLVPKQMMMYIWEIMRR